MARLDGKTELTAVVTEGDEIVPRAGLFVAPKQELRSDLHARPGCELTPQGRIAADQLGRTNVPRVYVAGDAGPGQQSVAAAPTTGMLAGAGLNHELATEDFDARSRSADRSTLHRT